MKWPSWLRLTSAKSAAATQSLTACPRCGREMDLIERTTMTGSDMRTYRCKPCQQEHIVNFGPALWKVLSDARQADKNRS